MSRQKVPTKTKPVSKPVKRMREAGVSRATAFRYKAALGAKGGEEMATLKLKTAREKFLKLELERERLQLENAKTKGDYISRKELAEKFMPVMAIVRSKIETHLTQLPPHLEGKSAGEMVPMITNALDESFADVREFSRSVDL